jgi:hypothetical protein
MVGKVGNDAVIVGDDSLETWVKLEEPMIANPPPSMPLVGWRDPYIFETMTSDNKHEWGMLLGSGIKGKGGSVMIYRSKSLRSGTPPPPLPALLEVVRGLRVEYSTFHTVKGSASWVVVREYRSRNPLAPKDFTSQVQSKAKKQCSSDFIGG